MDDPNIGFVIASYAVAVTVLTALIIANVVSYRIEKRPSLATKRTLLPVQNGRCRYSETNRICLRAARPR